MESSPWQTLSLSPKAPNPDRTLVDPPFSRLQPPNIPLIFSTVPASVWLCTLTSTSCLRIPCETSNTFHRSPLPPMSHHFLLQPSPVTMTILLVAEVADLRITLGSSCSLTPHREPHSCTSPAPVTSLLQVTWMMVIALLHPPSQLLLPTTQHPSEF